MKQKTSPTQKALNVWAIVLILWALYRAKFRTDLPVWFDEFIAKPAVFLIPVFYYISRYEKKNFFEAVSLRKLNMQGILYVALVIVAASGFLLALRRYADLPTPLTWTGFLYILVISLATSISEQVLTTGFVLHRLYNDSKNIFTSVFITSILFFFMHVPILFTNDKFVGYMLVRVMVTDLLLNVSISLTYLSRRNLVPAILIHTFYNMCIYLLMQ